MKQIIKDFDRELVGLNDFVFDDTRMYVLQDGDGDFSFLVQDCTYDEDRGIMTEGGFNFIYPNRLIWANEWVLSPQELFKKVFETDEYKIYEFSGLSEFINWYKQQEKK